MNDLTHNDLLADLILTIFNDQEQPRAAHFVYEYCSLLIPCKLSEVITICEEFCAHEVLEPFSGSLTGYYQIRRKGIQIVSLGGWLKYSQKYLGAKRREKILELAEDLIEYRYFGFRLTEYAAWIALVLSIASLVWHFFQ